MAQSNGLPANKSLKIPNKSLKFPAVFGQTLPAAEQQTSLYLVKVLRKQKPNVILCKNKRRETYTATLAPLAILHTYTAPNNALSDGEKEIHLMIFL